jgi:hypothetical protein
MWVRIPLPTPNVMKKVINRDICDVCGHYWSNPKSKKDSCSICGVGSCIKMNSKLDVRVGLRKGVSNEKRMVRF